MASVRFVYLWPVYGLFINDQCTVCLFMANVLFVYLWPMYRLFIYGQCTNRTLAINKQTVH
jgi:hypothetical protein